MRILLLLPAFLLCHVLAAQPTAPAPVWPVPSAAQLRWHEMELNAFIHFTTNTFTDKEWGYGNESPSVFAPTALDAGQWAKVLREAGFKGMILTAKHHDGFCLWPSRYTEHSVKNSPYKNGKGDVVREASEAAKHEGLKFGVYLSPWDRNHHAYGTRAYIDYYRAQLHELFTAYGPVFEMWFDGANGGDGYYGGANERRTIDRRTYYDWPQTLALVRKLQPQVLFFSDAGPDLRWVGNEEGKAGRTNWNPISNDTLYAGKADISELLQTGSEDGKRWIPAEVDVSIRPGWFYHAREDTLVRSGANLFRIYLNSVGRGSTLLLNIPPDRRGLLHEQDVQALMAFKAIREEAFARNRALHRPVAVSNIRGRSSRFSPLHLTDGKKETYWATDDSLTTATIEVLLDAHAPVRYLVVQEYIALGQRVKNFAVDVQVDGNWKEVLKGTTIGYKRILELGSIATRRVRLRILDARGCPLLSNLEIY